MKSGIHPEYMETKVRCNGCDTEFTTRSTVPEITVEICSECHPFYTGKQKLVDTAGRVDKFRARQEAAQKKQQERAKQKDVKDEELGKIEQELKSETVDIKKDESEQKDDK